MLFLFDFQQFNSTSALFRFFFLWPFGQWPRIVSHSFGYSFYWYYRSQVVIKNDYFFFSLFIFLPFMLLIGNRYSVVTGIATTVKCSISKNRIETRWRHIWNKWENSIRSIRWSKWKLDAINASLTRQRRHNEAIKNCRKQDYTKRKSFARLLLCHYADRRVLRRNGIVTQTHENFSCKWRHFAKHSADVVGRYDCFILVACVRSFIRTIDSLQGAHFMLRISLSLSLTKFTPNMINEGHRYE